MIITAITSRLRGATNLPLLRSISLHGVPFTVVVIPWILRDIVKYNVLSITRTRT